VLTEVVANRVRKPIQDGLNYCCMLLIGHNTLRSAQAPALGTIICAIATPIRPLPTRVMVGVASAAIAAQLHCHWGLESDLTLWLDVDVEVGLARHADGSYDRWKARPNVSSTGARGYS